MAMIDCSGFVDVVAKVVAITLKTISYLKLNLPWTSLYIRWPTSFVDDRARCMCVRLAMAVCFTCFCVLLLFHASYFIWSIRILWFSFCAALRCVECGLIRCRVDFAVVVVRFAFSFSNYDLCVSWLVVGICVSAIRNISADTNLIESHKNNRLVLLFSLTVSRTNM